MISITNNYGTVTEIHNNGNVTINNGHVKQYPTITDEVVDATPIAEADNLPQTADALTADTPTTAEADIAALKAVFPSNFTTPEMMACWDGLRDAGYLDCHYKRAMSRKYSAYIAMLFSVKLQLKKISWAPFHDFWNIKHLGQEEWQSYNGLKNLPEDFEKINEIMNVKLKDIHKRR